MLLSVLVSALPLGVAEPLPFSMFKTCATALMQRRKGGKEDELDNEWHRREEAGTLTSKEARTPNNERH